MTSWKITTTDIGTINAWGCAPYVPAVVNRIDPETGEARKIVNMVGMEVLKERIQDWFALHKSPAASSEAN